MATIVLGSVGAAIGGSLGGSVMGLSSAVIGRAVGATIGRAIDQRVMGGGADAVETGRVDRFRLTSASEGTPIPRVVGRYRLGGQVIWAGPFEEHRRTSSQGGGGGKGGGGRRATQRVTELSYTASVAVAVCEGEVSRVGRVWADGTEIELDTVEMRVYPGSEEQLPDPLIAAHEQDAPAYRGVCYVVFEDLDLGAFGNRVPQFSFEVVRPVRVHARDVPPPAALVRGAALIPGTGEHALATEIVTVRDGPGQYRTLNANGMTGEPDFEASLRDLRSEVKGLRSTSLVVSWFGDDLRCGDCTLRPLAEHGRPEARGAAWRVAGLTRAQAQPMPKIDGKVVYGGTPTDASVVQAIRSMNGKGIDVTFYPFTLMTPLAGNGRPDPWGGEEQPALPWRGRITCHPAPGRDGTVDRTAAAAEQVAAFFGTASASDFTVSDGTVSYGGPAEWSYRRFILHYAALCAAAGGVEAFCIGSEMRSLTQVRGAEDAFPAVDALRALAVEVRALLPMAKIGYAADWSEYFGYQPPEGGGALHFHLDPLWADDEIDFVGIDNYMPLSDWRDGTDHADAGWGSVHELGYLMSNVEGGEGYDWHYPTEDARAAQRREPITDDHGEPWVWRYKDLRSWWSYNHFDRPGGVRADEPTAWVPGSKPIRFTEYGCPAIHLGTNQPNVFVDPKSSESALPRGSDGGRDDAMQMQYLRALLAYWEAPGRMPVSPLDGRAMIDLDHSCVWAWDTRPYPAFPANEALWADAPNWARGHWWSGRSGMQPLSSVLAEACEAAGIVHYDVSRIRGVVRGMAMRSVATARADLQPLLLAHGVEAAEVDGTLRFTMRADAPTRALEASRLVRGDGPPIARDRDGALDVSGRVRVHHVDADGDFDVVLGDAVHPGADAAPIHDTELDMALTGDEGQALAERFLADARVGRDRLSATLAPSRRDVVIGDLILVDDETWRVDRLTEGQGRIVEAVRADASVYRTAPPAAGRVRRMVAPSRSSEVDLVVLDLPLLRGDEVPHAPHVAATAEPWSGPVAVYGSFGDNDFALDTVISGPARMGETASDLLGASAGIWDEGPPLLVDLPVGSFESNDAASVLGGGNAVAVGSGIADDWEIMLFRSADLVAPRRWALRGRLRGVRGTEDAIQRRRPVGSWIVALADLDHQLPVAPAHVGRVRNLRYGPAARGVDHSTFHGSAVFLGARGLRPFAPVHLCVRQTGTTTRVEWQRRTRIAGDGWTEDEIPLGEANERYRLRVLVDGTERLRRDVGAPFVELPSADVPLGSVVEVAQLSDRVGVGIAGRVVVG
ncbi:glycoside hydrolase/phage tail family protein [Jannaschia sp. Os4]|uniref:baseplate multidomain protein megatron n=1 Tax=Jannaschia sp. Os4 TaxID=2807617 RepID=UPI00193AC1AD|nr:glycoside hydrolase/phage tail family protein [Jannaschia sp. Os4]MBM2576806.1 glycoside hydrolase/phage tail family protein [Jannaschia sp. Os4]